ncbi:hypothetical protein IAQ61_002445 [Plenodomus lingam]|uniref:Sequence orphan n=1 Tax=Leptosphaeria maculans (strain JN3 / isolate v23.1.3 / race Av1-4-5-6-7-8) TaxID=985895 RepID=E4ZIF5_LEPMJ|nr:hypothetical protein LEMA_P060100.1 [Plenodomus lingam JN3]KAH9877082.1 hypothetical protein IAQ61_002445 [Plenodomus lingam]CBX90976.1 hypothetical protein LEMA_P060100.1 [Plenodomus lingam JN3]
MDLPKEVLPPSPKLQPKYNTHKLGLRVGVDAMAAGAAGVLVAPVITMIDKGIMQNASGANTLGGSLQKSAAEMLRRPLKFVGSRPFLLVFTLYFGTYMTANTTDTISTTLNSTPLDTTTSGTSKFLATSTANLSLCLFKDAQFTKLFAAANTPVRPVPLPTFALFTIRDALTIFASFNLPPRLAPHFSDAMGAEIQRNWITAPSAAQFVTPAAVQLFSTPLHLLGLDLYNRPQVSAGDRVARVLRDWGKSALARVGRIVPAFGVGGVVNMKVRGWGMRNLQERS